MNVNDIKKHIHAELFEKSIFSSSHDNLKSIEDMKGQWKKDTILHCIRIMRNHNQTDDDICKMLEDKFFLDHNAISKLLEEEKKPFNDWRCKDGHY